MSTKNNGEKQENLDDLLASLLDQLGTIEAEREKILARIKEIEKKA
jgi:hypothetical protein